MFVPKIIPFMLLYKYKLTSSKYVRKLHYKKLTYRLYYSINIIHIIINYTSMFRFTHCFIYLSMHINQAAYIAVRKYVTRGGRNNPCNTNPEWLSRALRLFYFHFILYKTERNNVVLFQSAHTSNWRKTMNEQ